MKLFPNFTRHHLITHTNETAELLHSAIYFTEFYKNKLNWIFALWLLLGMKGPMIIILWQILGWLRMGFMAGLWWLQARAVYYTGGGPHTSLNLKLGQKISLLFHLCSFVIIIYRNIILQYTCKINIGSTPYNAFDLKFITNTEHRVVGVWIEQYLLYWSSQYNHEDVSPFSVFYAL